MKCARDGILKAATELFARKGYAGCSIREICQAAGVTKPVLYYHFRSKEHVYQELLLNVFNQTATNLLMLTRYRGNLRERLVKYVSTEFQSVKRDPETIRLLFRMMFSPEGDYPRFNFVEEFQRERAVVMRLISTDGSGSGRVDPELTSSALMGMMLIQILEHLFTGRRTLTRKKAEKIVNLLLPSSAPVELSIPSGIEGEPVYDLDTKAGFYHDAGGRRAGGERGRRQKAAPDHRGGRKTRARTKP